MANLDKLTGLPSDLVQIKLLVDNKQAEFVSRTFEIDGLSCQTIDCKLPRFKEDALYNDPTIRMLIPRGCCYIFINNKFVHAVYGHSKFGNYGDYLPKGSLDDDCIKVFKRKENGECCHLSFFEHNKIIYSVIGSKNVHIVVRLSEYEEYIRLYVDQRYLFATKIAQELFSKPFSDILIKYVLETKYTLCGELCSLDSQHLVQYSTSNIYWFAMTTRRTKITDPIVPIHPIAVDDLIKSFGLLCVTESIISGDKKEFEHIENHFETQENSEGAVVSCISRQTSEVLYVYKHKNFDYVFERSLREQMKKKSSELQILNRFNNLHIKHPNITNLTQWALKFNAYYRLLTDEEQHNFFSLWVTHKNTFNSLSVDQQNRLLELFRIQNEKVEKVDVYMFVALPGSGKSFLSNALKELIMLNTSKKVIRLEQDMFSNKKAYHNAIKKALTNDIDILILSKSNHSVDVRNATYEVLQSSEKTVNITYIKLLCENNLEKTSELCIARIICRSLAHTTLFGLTEAQIRHIIQNVFVKQYEDLTSVEQDNPTIIVDINGSKNQIIMSCVEQLKILNIIDLNYTDETIANIIGKISAEDEELIMKNRKTSDNKKKRLPVVYDCLACDKDEINKILIDLGLNLGDFKMKDEFHVTLEYHGNVDKTTLHKFEENVKYDIVINGYALDDKALALSVVLPNYPAYGDKEHLHITSALENNIKPVYSLELIETSKKNKTLIEIENITIKGLTKRF